jgi:hypothetical protein
MSFWKSKTTWTGIAGIIGAIGGALTGTLDVGNAAVMGVLALMGIFQRSATSKLENKVNK